jgi:VanZ family protein
MLKNAFTEQSTYKKRARTFTILWTLLIFLLCLIPGNELPGVKIPMADKWVHFLLFGIFSFLWMCAGPSAKLSRLFVAFAVGCLLGWAVEELQGLLTSLGRSKSVQDIFADTIGSVIGVMAFRIAYAVQTKKSR